jgi:2-polyprenyl-3-methyl-5-hydroxy-6-metoxy-1,4-benzoquinol methylase
MLASNLRPGASDAMRLDGARRAEGLAPVRRRNFARILAVIERLRPAKGPRRLLDVGSGDGMFMDAARASGYDVAGIDCDAEAITAARTRGHRVVEGVYPDDLSPESTFDVITFNDSFEHLGDPRGGAAVARTALSPGGFAVLNLPSSSGTLFRLARALDLIGLHGPFERMWQRAFPSPHRTYFHPDALCTLWEAAGFRERYRGRLASISPEGLWSRIRYGGGTSFAGAVIVWVALLAGHNLLRVTPPDITLHVFERVD